MKHFQLFRKRRGLFALRVRRGFTMIEMMLVIAIIIILIGGAVVFMGGTLDEAKFQVAEDTVQKLAQQIVLYQTRSRMYPSTEQGLEALVRRPTTGTVPTKWRPLMDEIPLDPWGNPYQYRYPGVKNPGKFDVFSMGPDGRSDTADDVGNWK